jgi:hypothetical protein
MSHPIHRCRTRSFRSVACAALIAWIIGGVPGDVSAGTGGAQLWEASYHGPTRRSDDAADIGVSPDGATVFVTGQSVGAGTGRDYATIAYDTLSGARLWTKRYDGPANSHDDAIALAVSPDGSRVFVTGYSEGLTGGGDFATVAYDAQTGAQRWVKRYDGPGHDYDTAYAAGVSADGSAVVVAGISSGSTAEPDYATVAYSAATGARLWVQRYQSRDNGYDGVYLHSLAMNPLGTSVFVTGYSGSTDNLDVATVGYDLETGSKLWSRRYAGPAGFDDVGVGVEVSPDGSTVYISGYSRSKDSSDFVTLAYDAPTGTRMWIARYDGRVHGYDFAYALDVSPDGSRVYVTGSSNGTTSVDFATVAYDASTGAAIWVRRYDDPTNDDDYPSALRVSPDGASVFVTGGSSSLTLSDYRTVAYDTATGVRRWVAIHDGPAHLEDQTRGLVVSPDGGTVFVTGASTEATGNDIYTTVAYRV